MTQDVVINGVECRVYYPNEVDPNNIDPNTQVALYMHGGGNWMREANDATRYLTSSNSSNSIIIIPNASDRSTEAYFNDVVEAYDSFLQENNINQNGLVISGYSSGYRSTFGVLDTYLEKHPDSDPASVYLVDTYKQNASDRQYEYNYEAYKQNNTMFYSYTPKYDYKSNFTENSGSSLGATYYETLEPLSDNGCNVINILEGRIVSHHGVEQVFFEDGVIDFSSGGFILSGDNYIYQIKNPETGLWEEIDVNDINTINKMREKYGIVKLPMIIDNTYFPNLNYLSSLGLNKETVSNDSDTLLNHISNIYSAIKNSSFVTNNYVSNGALASTTKVPSSIPKVINRYFSYTSNLLCELAKFLKQCEESNTLMEETEESIKKDAEEVNDNVAVNLGVDVATASAVVGADLADKELEVGKPEPVVKEETKDTTDEVISEDNMTNNTIELPKDRPDSKDVPKTTIPVKKVNYNPENIKQGPDTNNSVSDWKAEFPEYNELYSTDDKVVFDYNNEYKVILHRNGETITGIEYYYDFGSSENAANALFNLKSMYQDSGIENIMMKDRYVKVIFNDSMFNNLSVSTFRNKYSNLNEIVKL